MSVPLNHLLNPAPDHDSTDNQGQKTSSAASAHEAALALADLSASTVPRPVALNEYNHVGAHCAGQDNAPPLLGDREGYPFQTDKSLLTGIESSVQDPESYPHVGTDSLMTLLPGVELYARTLDTTPFTTSRLSADEPLTATPSDSKPSDHLSPLPTQQPPSLDTPNSIDGLDSQPGTKSPHSPPPQHDPASHDVIQSSAPSPPQRSSASYDTINAASQPETKPPTSPSPPPQQSPGPLPTTAEPPMNSMASHSTKKRLAPKTVAKKGAAQKGPPAKKRKLDTPNVASKQSNTSAKKKRNSKHQKSASAAMRRTQSGSVDPEAAESGQDDHDVEADAEDDDSDDDQVYCICRRPDNGTIMIGCDGECNDWFHSKCVGITDKDRNLIDRYICPECEKKGVGPTTWKRMCRRPGCRMPARLDEKKKTNRKSSDGGPSKYCSEECGVLMFEELLKSARSANNLGTATNKKFKESKQDLGPVGGLLSAGELKALVTSNTIDGFRRLGEGVLSPPPTPNGSKSEVPSDDYLLQAMATTERNRLSAIQDGKERARARHLLLKDRCKFITMSKQAATQLAESKNISPRDLCGYDPRVSWDEATFDKWRASAAGQACLETNVLKVTVDDSKGSDGDDGTTEPGEQLVCAKKKCARDFDWAKLALDDARSQIVENGELMRALDGEERDIKETAGIKARAFKADHKEDYVEIHTTATGDAKLETVVDDGDDETTEPAALPDTPVDEPADVVGHDHVSGNDMRGHEDVVMADA